MIVIRKANRTLELHQGGQCTLMRIGLGHDPIGHKAREGDGKTPEGRYYICTRNARSKYHLSLGLSYPNPQDAGAALRAGLIDLAQCKAIERAAQRGRRPPWDTPLGGFIMLHGGGAGDWTAGCVAVSDADIELLWDACPMGTEVVILP